MPVMLEDKRIPKEYWAQPKRGTWSKITEQRFREQAKAPLVIPLDRYMPWLTKFREMRKDETPNPSLGLSSVIFACAMLKPTCIRLVGFDNLLNPNLMWYDRADKGPRWPTRHEWDTEAAMLPLIEQQYGVEISAF